MDYLPIKYSVFQVLSFYSIVEPRKLVNNRIIEATELFGVTQPGRAGMSAVKQEAG